MQDIFLSTDTIKKLHKFMNRSRVSNDFGAEKRLKSFDNAISMLLDFALRYDYDTFERMTKIQVISGEMAPKEFDNTEVRNKIISEKFNELDENEGIQT